LAVCLSPRQSLVYIGRSRSIDKSQGFIHNLWILLICVFRNEYNRLAIKENTQDNVKDYNHDLVWRFIDV